MKNKLLAICFLCLPVYSIIAQENTQENQEENQEETQRLVEEFYLPHHEKMARKKAREQAEKAETQAIGKDEVDEKEGSLTENETQTIDEEDALTENEIPNNIDLNTAMVEETSENEDDINYCSLISNNRDKLLTEFVAKTTILSAVDATLRANQAIGLTKLNQTEQKLITIPTAVGAWLIVKYGKQLSNGIIKALLLFYSGNTKNYITQQKRMIKGISEYKKTIKQLTKIRNQAQKDLKTSRKERPKILKELKQYWIERHQTGNYALHTETINALDEKLKQLDQVIINSEYTVRKGSNILTSNLDSKDIKKTREERKKLIKEQEKYWAERHKAGNYELYKKRLELLNEETRQVNNKLKSIERTVEESSEIIQKNLGKIEVNRQNIKALLNYPERPFLYRTRNFIKGTLFTGVALVGLGAYAAILGETATIVFEGLEELQKIHNQFTVDTLIISDCLGIDEDILDVILNN